MRTPIRSKSTSRTLGENTDTVNGGRETNAILRSSFPESTKAASRETLFQFSFSFRPLHSPTALSFRRSPVALIAQGLHQGGAPFQQFAKGGIEGALDAAGQAGR